MQCPDPSSPIVVMSDDGTRFEISAADGNVHVTIDRPEATLGPRAADDLVHAVLEVLS